MTFLKNFRGDVTPFVRTNDGEEVPAVYLVGGKVSLAGVTGDDDQVLLTDAESNALVSLGWEHHQVHVGQMFHAEYSYGTVANNGNADMRILTPAKEVHTVFFVGHGGQCNLYLYEAPSISGGTAVPVLNMNRVSLHTPSSTVFHTPAIVGVGTTPLVNGRTLGGGTSPQSRVGGGIRSGTEWLLKHGTEYLLRVTNTSGAGIAISIAIEFYEEE